MSFDALVPVFHEKVWGSPDLAPWFENPENRKIGEVWLQHPSGRPTPLLLKFLFTTGRLSVQVHPGDEYAARHHQSPGKTEMWHVLRSDPGAQVAIGLNRAVTAEELREASLSGEIESLLNWVPANPGDTFFVPAGTIHAIGEGLAICEIQQQSDVTYRLYDYGRPRELHLDHSIAVSHLGAHRPVPQPEGCLVHSDYFRTEYLSATALDSLPAASGAPYWLISIAGGGTIGGRPFRAGEAFEVSPFGEPLHLKAEAGTAFLRTWVP